MKRKRQTSFRDEAAQCFQFLVDDLGATEPSFETFMLTEILTYAGSDFGYRVSFDVRGGNIDVTVWRGLADGDENRAELGEIVVAAGLAPRQRVLTNARSSRLLAESLKNLAEWVRQTHPLVMGLEGVALLSRASGR